MTQIILITLVFLPLKMCNTHFNNDRSDNSDNNYSYWEQMTSLEKQKILDSKRVYVKAIDFYNDKLELSDNEETFALIDTLSSYSKEDDLLSFYFYLFNSICMKSDGVLSEILGKYCQNIIINHPYFVMDYFRQKPEIRMKYAEYLGFELYFKQKGTSDMKYNFDDFKRILKSSLANSNSVKEVLNLFYKDIETSMKNAE